MFHPHISGMALLRRFRAFMPAGRVAALVAVLLLVGMAGAWALDFPRVGLPGQSDEAAMQTGFAVQWALFGGFSGQKGNALYYLALTAGMVGLMLIVTNAKYRNPPVLVSWFIILLLLLFAPYNSRLLFYPVSPGASDCSYGKTSAVNSTTGAVASSDGVCGFTPQVIAAHLGTVMTLIMTDVFQSMGMQNAVKQALNAAELRNSEELIANQPARGVINGYRTDPVCGGATKIPMPTCFSDPSNPSNVSSTASASAASASADGPSSAMTLAQMYDKLEQAAREADLNTQAGSLPAMIFPTSVADARKVGFNDKDWAAYVNGISHIWASMGSGRSSGTVYDPEKDTSPAAGRISVGEAVKQILAVSSANAGAMPMTTMSYYVASDVNGSSLASLRQTVGTLGSGGVTTENVVATLTDDKESTPGGMAVLLRAMKNSDLVRNMPVGRAGVSVAPTLSASGQGNAEVKVTAVAGKDCAAVSNMAYKDLVNKQFPNVDYTQASGKLIADSLLNCKDIPISTITNAGGYYTSFGNQLAEKWGNAGQGTIGGQDLVKFFLGQMTDSMSRQSTPTEAKVAAAATSLPQNNGLGSGPVGWALGKIIEGLGVSAAGLFGWLAGIMASGFLMVLRSLIDLMIMVMLVVTPLMFMMGLLIPTNAPGMLFVTTIGLLVLKLVPMTTVIIDFMIGLARGMSHATSTNGVTAFLWDGIILGAASGMYMGVIGLTLFILFKLGDPSNISQLRGLEGAAKSIAEAGKRLGIALGVGMATLGAGAAVGGISGGRAAARMAMSGTRLGKASEMLENLKASSEAKTEASKAAEAPVTGGTPTDGVKPGIPEVDITGDPAAEFARREADAAKAFGEDGLTQEMGKDAGGWQNVNGAFAEHLDMGGDPDGPRKVKTANGRTYTAELKDGKWVATGFEEGLPEGDTKLAQQVASLKNGEQATVTLSDGSTQTWARDENGVLARVASTEAPAPGKDATVPAPTVAPPATSAGASVRTPAGYVSEADAEKFEALSKDNRATVEGLANGEKAEVTLSDNTTRTWERTDDGKLKQRASVEDDKHFKDFSDKLDRISTSIRDAIKQGFDQATMNRLSEDNKDAPLQSNAAFKAEIEALVNADVLSQAQAKKILNSSSYDEALKEVSDVRARQTEYLEKIGVAKNGDNFDGASAAWRGGLKGARSGLYGSIQAFKNAGGSLPVIGPIIKEILNEDREAHDRAVVIAMAGGMKDYKRSQKLAERNSFVNKEMSTLGGAESYRNNLVQAQYSNTIQAARQGAAKAVEDFTARARTGRTDSTGAFSFSDMRANARMGAISEATSISTGAMSIKNANITLQGGRSVSLNPAVLQELGMRASLGDANKKIGGQFDTGYAMEPKLDKRGVNDLRDGKQIGDYIQGATGRDYVVSGIINNMGGRASFMAKEAEALRMLDFAKGNMNNSELNKYFSMGAELKAARNYQKFMNPMAKHTRDDLAEMLAEVLDKSE